MQEKELHPTDQIEKHLGTKKSSKVQSTTTTRVLFSIGYVDPGGVGTQEEINKKRAR